MMMIAFSKLFGHSKSHYWKTPKKPLSARVHTHTHGVRCYSSSSSSVSLPKHCNLPSSCSFSYYYRLCSADATTIACLVHCHDDYTDVFHCKQKNRSTGASSSFLLLLCWYNTICSCCCLVVWVFFFLRFLLLLPQVRASKRRRRGARAGKATGQNHMFWMWTQ